MDTRKVKLEEFAHQYLVLKNQEAAIRAKRFEVEVLIIAAMDELKDEGTTTEKTDEYKISVTTKLTRALDYPAYCAIEADIPEGIRCVNLKPEIDVKKLRAMDRVRPGFSAQFITTKPAKTSVKIEML